MEPHEVRKRIKATWNDALIRVFEKHFLSYPEKIVRRKHVPEPVRLAGHDEATEFDSDPVYPFNQKEMLWTTQKISMYFHSGCYATFAAMTPPYLQKKSSEYGVIPFI
jgi:hypothetical protein